MASTGHLDLPIVKFFTYEGVTGEGCPGDRAKAARGSLAERTAERERKDFRRTWPKGFGRGGWSARWVLARTQGSSRLRERSSAAFKEGLGPNAVVALNWVWRQSGRGER